MRIERLPIAELIPGEVGTRKTISYMHSLASCLEKTPPITTFPIGEHYFVGDGNHRVVAGLMRGEETILGKIIETDEDMYKCQEGIFIPHRTLEEFRISYPGYIEHMEANGIKSFEDLLSQVYRGYSAEDLKIMGFPPRRILR